jgi:hypothetical protein
MHFFSQETKYERTVFFPENQVKIIICGREQQLYNCNYENVLFGAAQINF